MFWRTTVLQESRKCRKKQNPHCSLVFKPTETWTPQLVKARTSALLTRPVSSPSLTKSLVRSTCDTRSQSYARRKISCLPLSATMLWKERPIEKPPLSSWSTMRSDAFLSLPCATFYAVRTSNVCSSGACKVLGPWWPENGSRFAWNFPYGEKWEDIQCCVIYIKLVFVSEWKLVSITEKRKDISYTLYDQNCKVSIAQMVTNVFLRSMRTESTFWRSFLRGLW